MSSQPILARVASPSAPVSTEVGSDVWEALLDDAFERLADRAQSVFGAADINELRAKWCGAPVAAREARNYAEALRKAAFLENAPGAVAVEIGTDEDPPGHLAVLAAVFDYLATLAGPNGLVFFAAAELDA